MKISSTMDLRELSELMDPNGYGNVTEDEAKQWMRDGWTRIEENGRQHWRRYYRLKDRAGADPAEWPKELRVREFPA